MCVTILYIYFYVNVLYILFLKNTKQFWNIFSRARIVFCLADDTYVDKIADQNYDKSSEARSDAGRLGW